MRSDAEVVNEVGRDLNRRFTELGRIRAEAGVAPGESLYDALDLPKWWVAADA